MTLCSLAPGPRFRTSMHFFPECPDILHMGELNIKAFLSYGVDYALFQYFEREGNSQDQTVLEKSERKRYPVDSDVTFEGPPPVR